MNYLLNLSTKNHYIFSKTFTKVLGTYGLKNFSQITIRNCKPVRLKNVNTHLAFLRFASNNIKNTKIHSSDVKRLLNLARPEKWKLLGAIILLFISSGVTMGVPFSLGKILDLIYESKGGDNKILTKEKLNNICLLLLAIFALGAVCNFGRIYLMSTSGYRMTQALRMQVFNSIVKQEVGFFDKRATGELINRLSVDTQMVGNALSQNISDGLRSTCMVLAGTSMMLYTSPQLALVGFCLVPPVAIIAVAYGRFVRKITRNVQDNLAKATTLAEEKISNIRTVKTFNKEMIEMKNYSERLKNVLNLGYKESLARAVFFAFNGFTGNAIIIAVLYYGGVLVNDQAITLGNLSAFLMYAAYIGVSIGGLTSFYSELNKSLGAASRLWQIIDRQPGIPIVGGLHPDGPPAGRIIFDDVSFSYPSRDDTQIFNNLTLDIKPGQTLAVVGPSGSGKSTMGALLLRLYEPKNGKILLDDINIKDLDPNWLRKNIGTVSQEPVLFSGTIKENILYGADDPSSITEEQLLKAAQEANILEFCQSLPDKFDTLVGERGVMLSGGQKQRIAIARALIKNPKILILDEATSALDAHSEFLVQEALQNAMKGRTVLTIAHRLSTIRNASTIAVLDNGKIVQLGNYDTLLSQTGQFKDLVEKQTFATNVSS